METIVKCVLRHGAEQQDRLAVALKDVQLSYGELKLRMLSAAEVLQRKFGLVHGDMAALSAVSKPDFVVAYLALQYLGVVTVPLDKSAKETVVRGILDTVRPRLLLTDAAIREWPEETEKASMRQFCAEAASCAPETVPAYEEPGEEQLAELIFTTGTTGKPKGAMLTYGNVAASTRFTWEGIGMKESDRVLLPLPLNHSFGLRVLRAALYGGASVVLQNGFSFAKDLETNLERYRCTGMVSVPATMEILYGSMRDRFSEVMGQLRYIEISAGSLPAPSKRRILEALPNTELHNTWGSSETGGAIFLNASEHPDKLFSIGKPFEGVEYKAVDEEGRSVRADSVETAGRMALRGPMQMAGYYGMPELSAETLHDGWLYTGDMTYRDADGYIYMLGRADDIINVGGEKVSPIEVENAAMEFEEIRECACIGVEDPEGVLGQVPVLFVVPEKAAFHEEACEKYLLDKLERHKLPHRYILRDKLPRNRMQKIDRKELRAIYESGGENVTNEVIRDILTRRSIREFTDQPISREMLETLAECGTYAPSGHNMQTWRFTIVQSDAVILRVKETVREVAKRERAYFYGFNHPTALILVSNDRRNRYAVQDASCAAQNIMLAAHSLGLGSVWINAMMSICDEPEIRELLRGFDIPDTHIVWATIALGWPAQEGKLLAKKQDVVRWIE